MGIALMILAVLGMMLVAFTIKIVPQQSAWVVERLGRFYSVLESGVNIVFPFVDRIAYKHSLKEFVIDVPEQICITKDNVQVGLDGVLYLRVVTPKDASYGISNYVAAITQLAQTTMRSEIGKIVLEKTFEERSIINSAVITAVDEAAQPWGVKIMRYEIKNINPPTNIIQSMEMQMVAEREKRAAVLKSEGVRDAAINSAEGAKQSVVKQAQGEMERQKLVAEGQANAIIAVAEATAQGIKMVAASIKDPGGAEAMQLRVAEQMVAQFGGIAKAANTLILPANFGDMGSMVATVMKIIKTSGGGAVAPAA